MIAFKGFNKDMTCRDFQYKEGEEYTEPEASIYDDGFHACKYPLDCFTYYSPNSSEYHMVDLDNGKDDVQTDDRDSKICGKHIKIGAKLDIAELVKASIEYTNKHINISKVNNEDYGTLSVEGDCSASLVAGNRGASSATGDCGASLVIGNSSVSSSTGDSGASSATGYCGVSSATGRYGTSSVTGACGASSATGRYGISSATGISGASSATGNYSVSSATGNYSVSSATGACGASSVESNHSIAISFGIKGRAKGAKGAYIVLADWTVKNGVKHPSLCTQNGDWDFNGVKMVQIDDINYKSNTWYTIKNHEIVEWDDKN